MNISNGNFKKVVLVTGGCGFIGSNLLNILVPKYPDIFFVNADCLTYAANTIWTRDLEQRNNYTYRCVDISSKNQVNLLFNEFDFNIIIHMAAESHVDNSIINPILFLEANVLGTGILLSEAMKNWSDPIKKPTDKKPKFKKDHIFLHISTDEVFGHLQENEPAFTEYNKYNPRSPYSASKAGSDHLVRAYRETYGFPATITNCSNNYGPFQFPEKLIPNTIISLINGKNIPIYGKGENIRDWIHVSDHISAIELLSGLCNNQNQDFGCSPDSCTYNPGFDVCIGANNEWTNVELVSLICDLYDFHVGKPFGTSKSLITFVEDRMGHDLRYAINSSKLEKTGWKAKWNRDKFPEALMETIVWYCNNYKKS
jgi:dTDP-glucose 4,6-dehydratase